MDKSQLRQVLPEVAYRDGANRLAGDAELGSEGVATFALRTSASDVPDLPLGQFGAGIPCPRTMQSAMFFGGEDKQVVGVVVRPVAIDMVDNFIGREVAPLASFDNQTMLCDAPVITSLRMVGPILVKIAVAALNATLPCRRILTPLLSLRDIVTGAGAETLSPDAAGIGLDWGIAGLAGDGNLTGHGGLTSIMWRRGATTNRAPAFPRFDANYSR
jgi:hypothetical protein